MKAKKLPFLTELRFFAALYVIFFHHGNLFSFLPGPAFLFLHHGYSAVSFFFVLSGFIIYYTYSKLDVRVRELTLDYRISRFVRIYPAYIIALLMACVTGFYLYVNLGDFSHIATDLMVFVLSIFMLQGFMASYLDSGLNVNAPGWSLTSELVFYISFPWLLRLVSKLRTAKGIITSIILCWLLTMVAPAIFDYYFFGDPLFSGSLRKILPQEGFIVKAYLFLRAFPLFHLPQFVVGVLFAKLFMEFDLHAYKKRVLLFGAISFICAMGVLCTDAFSSDLINNGFLSLFFGSIILALLFISDGFIPMKGSMEKLGIASYSMYIFAIPVERIFTIALKKTLGIEMNLGFFFVYVAAVIGVSLFFERFDTMLRQTFKRRMQPVIYKVKA